MNQIEITGALISDVEHKSGLVVVEGWELQLHAYITTGAITLKLVWFATDAWKLQGKVHSWIYAEEQDVKVVGELMGGTHKPFFVSVHSIEEVKGA